MAIELCSAPINTTKNKDPNYFGIPILPSQAELQLLHHFL
jgi:hypothetical protein